MSDYLSLSSCELLMIRKENSNSSYANGEVYIVVNLYQDVDCHKKNCQRKGQELQAMTERQFNRNPSVSVQSTKSGWEHQNIPHHRSYLRKLNLQRTAASINISTIQHLLGSRSLLDQSKRICSQGSCQHSAKKVKECERENFSEADRDRAHYVKGYSTKAWTPFLWKIAMRWMSPYCAVMLWITSCNEYTAQDKLKAKQAGSKTNLP